MYDTKTTHESVTRTPPPRKFIAKGHDSQLQDAQFSQREVVVRLMSGEDITGLIKRRDKWTITVQEHDAKHSVIIYKHAIETVVIKNTFTEPV